MNGSSAIHLTMFGLNPVVKFGNDRLKQTFLPRAATGDLHVAFGVTEPDAGTDTSRITTRRLLPWSCMAKCSVIEHQHPITGAGWREHT
jgi:hypothetical protein